MTFFFFLPRSLLSGFMFPFRGMPEWAQWIGSLLAPGATSSCWCAHHAERQRPADLCRRIWPIVAFIWRFIAVGLGFLPAHAGF